MSMALPKMNRLPKVRYFSYYDTGLDGTDDIALVNNDTDASDENEREDFKGFSTKGMSQLVSHAAIFTY